MPRRITRKIEIVPDFRDFDPMGVVNNCAYFEWFERGRIKIMDEIMPFEQMARLGAAVAVRENRCVYENPVRKRSPLALVTRHKIAEPYCGKLEFTHELLDEKTKTAHAFCECVCVLVDPKTLAPLREAPAEIAERYALLK